jgi:hypothetical protein
VARARARAARRPADGSPRAPRSGRGRRVAGPMPVRAARDAAAGDSCAGSGHRAVAVVEHHRAAGGRALIPDLGHAESGHGRGSEMIDDHGP